MNDWLLERFGVHSLQTLFGRKIQFNFCAAGIMAKQLPWPDLAVLRRVALACAPAQAHAEVQAVAHYVTQRRGGDGAARELCDLVLTAGGHYARFWHEAMQ